MDKESAEGKCGKIYSKKTRIFFSEAINTRFAIKKNQTQFVEASVDDFLKEFFKKIKELSSGIFKRNPRRTFQKNP